MRALATDPWINVRLVQQCELVKNIRLVLNFQLLTVEYATLDSLSKIYQINSKLFLNIFSKTKFLKVEHQTCKLDVRLVNSTMHYSQMYCFTY